MVKYRDIGNHHCQCTDVYSDHYGCGTFSVSDHLAYAGNECGRSGGDHVDQSVVRWNFQKDVSAEAAASDLRYGI